MSWRRTAHNQAVNLKNYTDDLQIVNPEVYTTHLENELHVI